MLGDTAVIILTTPYCIGTLLAMFLNTIIPMDEDEEPEDQALLMPGEPVKQAPAEQHKQAAPALSAAPDPTTFPPLALQSPVPYPGAPATGMVYTPNYAQQYAAPVAAMPQPAAVPMQPAALQALPQPMYPQQTGFA
jgi:hypothetical protein